MNKTKLIKWVSTLVFIQLATVFIPSLASAEDACTPITSLSCSDWPQQIQVIGTVIAVIPMEINDKAVCQVTMNLEYSSVNGICPFYLISNSVTYQVCGACPALNSPASGVIMKNASGLTVLDR